MPIPVGWLQLTHEKGRLAAAIIGISFAVVLMLTQLGFQDALLLSTGVMHASFIGDLVLISPDYQNLDMTQTITENRLYQTLSSKAVDKVYPLYLESAQFKNPVNRKDVTMYVVGFKPTAAVLDRPGIAENLKKLQDVGSILYDTICRPEFGPVADLFQRDGKVTSEIDGVRVDVVGLFQLGTSFGADGHVVMSDETFFHVLPYRQPGLINVGLIKLKPGADARKTKTELAGILPHDVELLTKDEFVNRELGYWNAATPIGFVFGLGVLVGVFIGCIIVYQILYTDVTNHLSEYATLKAMGYRNLFLFKVVIQQALVLSVLGFLPGVVVAHFVYSVAHQATLLPMAMSLPRVALVYLLTAAMCTISAMLAARKVRSADPAEIF